MGSNENSPNGKANGMNGHAAKRARVDEEVAV